MFKRPSPSFYIRVKYGLKSKQVDYYDIETASYNFDRICAYWRIYTEYNSIRTEIERMGYSHHFYEDSLDYTLDTMPLLKKSDLYSGLTPTNTNVRYDISNNSYLVFLIYCNRYDNKLKNFAQQFKTVGLSLTPEDTNIAWRITNNDVILCRYNHIEDFDNIYNNRFEITEQLYKHPNPTKFRYIAAHEIMTILADPILCSNPMYW